MATQIGMQGWSQMTPAIKQIISSGLGAARRTVSRRRSKSSKAATGKRRSKRSSSSKKRSSGSKKLKRFVKGSAAAKAYMAKLRAKRK